ncbi:tyrosine-type recombinase/integrase [Streptomyces poonensis]|uniref:Site-specific integrase n=1 Tax=Streptomyces poonensis TaxID=68255 RepID=A0A918PVD2_9ACTN|nr:tyrosine-type recombinase/integrase [Streptomyces poonensis]GGZ24172.1 site-specific integrase [Streptomyces poonensis]GLJ89936.1 site-specific integrase [Streptomyces poonensis]
MKSYNVRIWGIRRRDSKAAPFQVRWTVAGKVHQQPFATKTLADARRAKLLTAARAGEAFDVATGLPASELRESTSPTWYEHACAYALMKWPHASAKHRASIAEALTALTIALVSTSRGGPEPSVLRGALGAWAFRVTRTDDGEHKALKDAGGEVPGEVRRALDWVAGVSLKMIDVAESDNLRRALTALSRRLDGKPAATNTVRRKRMVLSNALRYAVERDVLPANPLGRVDWAAPDTTDEVDFQYVPGPQQARALLNAVRDASARGRHLHAFFGCLYYAAMRPSEVASLARRNCKLPAQGWGELVLTQSRPEVGSGWTDDGRSFEERGLKRRARKATRPVPIPPVLVSMLRAHLEEFGTAEDGRLFRAARGGRVRSTEYAELWQKAREAALTPEEAETPLAEVPYSLRHAGVSLWIKAGVDPVEVARRAGHSPAVLWRFYAKILRGHQSVSNQMIDAALADGG